MTKEKAKKLSELYLAVSEGEVIQVKLSIDKKSDWEDVPNLCNLALYNTNLLRIKPKYEHYTAEQMLEIITDYWEKYRDYPSVKKDQDTFRLVGVNGTCVILLSLPSDYIFVCFEELYDFYQWNNGEKCGVEVAE